MTRLIFPAALLMAAVAFACGPRARSAEPERRKVVNGPPVAAVLEVKVRDGIDFVFRVTNNAASKLELLFPTGQTHDIVVVDSLGREIWKWSEGRMFTQALLNRILESHGSLAWDASLRAKAIPPGRYTAVASLLSENKPLEQRVEFEVR
jgi:Intracellular proteinase inhibitor